MKPQKLRLSWCKFLFITTSDFEGRLELSHQTILDWIFVKFSYFLKPCCNYVFQVYPLTYIKKREKWTWLPHESFLLLQTLIEHSYFIVDNEVCLMLLVVPKLAPIKEDRQRCFSNPVEHLRWSFFYQNSQRLKTFNYFRKEAPTYFFE